MSNPKVRGKVHVVEETKTYGQNGFRNRLVVLEQDAGRFPNLIPLEFTNDDCDSVDGLSVGEEVEIVYELKGRKWQKDASSEVKYFLNAEARSFEVVGGGSSSSSSQETSQDIDAANAGFADAAVDEDDIPF